MWTSIIEAIAVAIIKSLFGWLSDAKKESILSSNAVLKEIIRIKDNNENFKKLLDKNAAEAIAELNQAIAEGKEDEWWNTGKSKPQQ